MPAAALCAGIALPVPMWALAMKPAARGSGLGVGQSLSMTTVVRAAPEGARSTALALRLTGNRLGQAAAPVAAGPVAGVAGVAAPFVMLSALLLLSSRLVLRAPSGPAAAPRSKAGPRRVARRRHRGGRGAPPLTYRPRPARRVRGPRRRPAAGRLTCWTQELDPAIPLPRAHTFR